LTDVDRLILEAWEKLRTKILSDPHELAKRLARRRSPTLTRPPRAWCIAIRASDRRITPMHWIITPEHAMDLNHPEHPYEPIEHTVTIQPHGLRKYCRPVRTDSWGELVQDVARQLGVHPSGLHRARLAGLFTERFVKGLGGKHGPPIPLIHSWTTLDPSGHNFSRPDPLWGGLWEYLPDMIPDDFEQTITRIPKFRPFRTNRPRPARLSLTLSLRPEGSSSKSAPRRRRKNHSRRIFDDGSQLIGYRWLCPACKKEVSKIYYPLPPRTLFDFLGFDPGTGTKTGKGACAHSKKFLRFDLHKLDPPPPTFACHRCHRIRGLTRTNHNGWNEIVSHLTRGLLYGHEVEKPAWYRTPRKRARSRQLHRPSPKRDAIFDRLQLGHTLDQITTGLLIPRTSVRRAILHICKQHGCKNRRELAAKLGWKIDQPLNARERIRIIAKERDQQIEQLLLQDLGYKEIAQKLRVSKSLIEHAAQRIYQRYNLSPKSGKIALAKNLGVKLPQQSISEEFRHRLLSGQSNQKIADAMHLTLIAVSSRIKKIIKKEGVRGRKGLFQKYPRTQVAPIPV
jgi:DNA-binding CsgD family transcriptional regulator